ncbi:fluoride efflux transporter CrcB [Halosquirtibacter xylanolyticus]|uniref:fluoride efflux transporter CrcB n=1 Tax=Halosquirtibacter xylanolyticus TaxID=3374599 RepID=UPI00374A2EC7|nr:fluoride efflux transporter CrcB [Prolixibacteraceae bacterium]
MGHNLLYIALGGSLGSICRFLIAYLLRRVDFSFPVGTMIANLLGCILIGVFYTLVKNDYFLSQEIRYIGIIGFCGSFTTFSSFVYENLVLIEKGQLLTFALYASLSFILGLACIIIGVRA